MAELKTHKRALESQKKIYKTVRKLLLTKPLIDITITDIEKESHVSRSTFYRNFNNVIEVIEVMLDYFYNRYLENKVGKEDQLLYFYEYWDKHKDLIYIVSHQSAYLLKNVMKKHEKDEKDPFMLDIKCSLMSSLLSVWVESKDKLTPKDMVEKTSELLNYLATSNFINEKK